MKQCSIRHLHLTMMVTVDDEDPSQPFTVMTAYQNPHSHPTTSTHQTKTEQHDADQHNNYAIDNTTLTVHNTISSDTSTSSHYHWSASYYNDADKPFYLNVKAPEVPWSLPTGKTNPEETSDRYSVLLLGLHHQQQIIYKSTGGLQVPRFVS